MAALFGEYGLFVRVESREKLLMVSSLGRWRRERPENRPSRECRNRPSQKLQPWLRLTWSFLNKYHTTQRAYNMISLHVHNEYW